MVNLVRVAPEAAGVSRVALEKLIADLDAFAGVHSLLVLRGGKVVAEANWAPYVPQQPHMMFSVTKTFTAIAIGLLVAEGKLSVDDKVIDLLPEFAPAKPSRKLQKMTVWHLLTMSTGHVTEPKVGRGNWARMILRHPVKAEPGSHFMYNPMASHLLSVIATKLTGQKLIDYLAPRLFEPLGYQPVTWEQDPQGNNTGGWGLTLHPEELAQLGQLLLQRGAWAGRQLVPASWVDAMMARQVDSSPQGWGPNSAAGYGYQMWRCPVDAARADGAFGQFAIVWPEHDAVIATTSGVDHSGPHSNYALLDTIYQNLENAFGEVPDIPIQTKDSRSTTTSSCAKSQDLESVNIRARTSVAELPIEWNGSLPMPQGAATSSLLEKIDGKPYVIDGTKDTVTLRRQGDLLELTYSHKPATTHVSAHGTWHRFTAPGPDGNPQPAASSYAWPDPHTLTLQTYGTATPFGWTHTLTWDDAAETIHVQINQNVAFNNTEILNAKAHQK